MKRTITIALAASLALAISCEKEKNGAESTAKVVDEVNKPVEDKTPTQSMVPITSKAPGAVALLRDGRSLQEGFRFADATAKYKKAVELDPEFALAHAQLASLTKGEAGQAHREKAIALSAKLPETERLYVLALVSKSKSDRENALTELAAKATGDWEVQIMVARNFQKKGKIDEARAAFEKAAELNPKAPGPHNNLAYIYAEKGDFGSAVKAVTKYATLSPGEPNPLDSKGEILLMAGKFAESEAAFSEALELDKSFAIAHEGIAATKFYRGDWEGGIAELRTAADNAPRAIDRYELTSKLGWALVAAGKDDQAKAAFEASAKAATEAGMPNHAGAALTRRAQIALYKKDYAAAKKFAGKALAAMVADGTPAKKQHWTRAIATIAAARAGNVADAEKSLAILEAEASDSHYTALAASHVALARNDPEGALAATAKLKGDKYFGGQATLLTAEALDKAGKADKAKKLRKELSTRYRRDIHSVMLAQEAIKAGEG